MALNSQGNTNNSMTSGAAGTPPSALLAEPDTINVIGLTPKQNSQWQDTMSLMAWACPGFRHLFYKLLSNNDGQYGCVPTDSIPVAATDQQNIMINPETFFKYNLKQRTFIMGHEVVHNVYGDCDWLKACAKTGEVPMNDGTKIPFRNATMQKAMDYRINALLVDSQIGELPPDACFDLTIATGMDSVVDAYKKVYEDEESGGSKTGKHNPIDQLLTPGKSNGKPAPRNPQQWAVEVAAAQVLESMKNQGKGSGALDRFFNEILDPVVPWTDHIQGIFNRKVGTGSYDWKRPDRRQIVRDVYFPSRSGNGAGWVVCWGDTSGSIGQDEMTKYLGELTGIIDDCQPTRLTMIWCDDEIKQIDEIEEACDLDKVRHNGAPGGGGTSVCPVFDWIKEHGGDMPEVFIGFTDGYVTYPDQPDVPVIIWAMTTEKDAPYGEVVRINPKRGGQR